MGPVARNGLSLPCNDCPFQGLHSRINVPGLLLRFLVYRIHCPFGLSAPQPRPVRPGTRPIQRFWPVAALPADFPGCSSSLHSPSGLLHPSGSKRSTGVAAVRPAFQISPISFRSPQPILFLSWLRIIVRGPLLFRRLAVSSNLLEPSSLCARSFFSSTIFCVLLCAFPQVISLTFSRGYRSMAVDWL
jgi:hypothetical protein